MVEASLLCSDSPGVKLGLDLGEPDLGISGAEGWQLDANCCDSYLGCLSGCGRRWSQ